MPETSLFRNVKGEHRERADPKDVSRAWNTSLHLMGSRTFRDMAGYWPTSTDEYAAPMNQIPKAVFSKQGSAILEAARLVRDSLTPFSPALKAGRRPMWRAAIWSRRSPS